MENKIIGPSQDFKPQLIIVSAGFDAVKDDGVGDFELTPGFFGHMTRVSQIPSEFDVSFMFAHVQFHFLSTFRSSSTCSMDLCPSLWDLREGTTLR